MTKAASAVGVSLVNGGIAVRAFLAPEKAAVAGECSLTES